MWRAASVLSSPLAGEERARRDSGGKVRGTPPVISPPALTPALSREEEGERARRPACLGSPLIPPSMRRERVQLVRRRDSADAFAGRGSFGGEVFQRPPHEDWKVEAEGAVLLRRQQPPS